MKNLCALFVCKGVAAFNIVAVKLFLKQKKCKVGVKKEFFPYGIFKMQEQKKCDINSKRRRKRNEKEIRMREDRGTAGGGLLSERWWSQLTNSKRSSKKVQTRRTKIM